MKWCKTKKGTYESFIAYLENCTICARSHSVDVWLAVRRVGKPCEKEYVLDTINREKLKPFFIIGVFSVLLIVCCLALFHAGKGITFFWNNKILLTKEWLFASYRVHFYLFRFRWEVVKYNYWCLSHYIVLWSTASHTINIQ